MYCKKLNENGEIESLLTYNNYHPNLSDSILVEITEEEYNILLAEIQSAHPSDESDTDEISDEEALNIILGVSE